MRYNPKYDFSKLEQSKKSFDLHFDKIHEEYGSVVVVDLLQEKGNEGKLKETYKKFAQDNKLCKFYSFDVQKLVGHNFSKLSLLDEMIFKDLDNQKIFSNKNNKQQDSIFRINCKDSLDRTNLIQSYISTKIIKKQLEDLEIKLKFTDIEPKFRNIWCDNGDALSDFYAGTGALKSYYTRTGKGSISGIIGDGYKAVQRFYLNNLDDGEKQGNFNLIFKTVLICL
jgi:phosphatidylinositol 4-phosphatase